MTGGIKEDVSQLELKGGELLHAVNYEEVDGAYHGYSSVPGYERFDGQALASSVDTNYLNDYGDDSAVSLLLESDLQECIEDISVYGHSVVNNGVVHDPNVFKFFRSSYYFGGSASLNITPVDTTLDLLADNFTIDLLLDPLDQVSTQIVLGKGFSYQIEIDSNRLVFKYSTDGLSWAGALTSNKFIALPTRLHVAVVRKADIIYLFFDGNRDDNTLTVGTDILFTTSDDLILGAGFIGRLDEVRVSKRLCWLIDFDIPVIPYSSQGYYTFQVDDTDREVQRALIAEVPGEGSILGIGLNEVGDLVAVRNNVHSTNSFIYRAGPTGWSDPIPGVFYGNFSDGTDSDSVFPGFQPGDIVTGSISGATAKIAGIIVQSGSWQDLSTARDAAGTKALKDVVGTFVDTDVLSNGGTVTAEVVDGTLGEFALQPDGDYCLIRARFDALIDLQRKNVPFFTNSVDFPMYYDGVQIIPILYDTLPDAGGIFACAVVEFKNRLWLAYPDGQLWYSAVGDPLNWDEVDGAGTIFMEDEITALQVGQGDVLIVFGRGSIQIIKSIVDTQVSGATTQADYAFFNETFSNVSGAIPGTVERILGEIMYFDDRGITKLSATDAYGDFSAASLSKNVQRTLLEKKSRIVTSAVHRENNQYRIFFNDKTGFFFTFDVEKKVKGVTSIKFNHDVIACVEGEDSATSTKLYFGSSDGFVYVMDSGTSFDGEPIETKLATAFYSYNSPTSWKRFRKITLEAQADKDFVFFGKPEFNYRTPNIPRSNTESYTSTGYGGVWGTGAWGLFTYGSEEVQSPALYMSGYGTNMSIRIVTRSKFTTPHVINNIITEYSLQGRKM